jgi:type IV secretion system protein TrbJ
MTRPHIRLFLTVTALALVVGPAAGQQVVYDPSNYAQNLLQAARALQQINNQIAQLENQSQSLINQAKHLVSLWAAVTASSRWPRRLGQSSS